MEYISIKEFAEKIGISKQAVYQQLNNKLKDYVIIVENKKMLKKSALKEVYKKEDKEDIKQNSQQVEQQLNNQFNNQIIEMLQKELANKDKQIAELLEQNSKQLKVIDQEQQLRLVAEQRLLAIEQKDQEEQTEQQEIKKHWWSWGKK